MTKTTTAESKPWRATPLVESKGLSRAAGCKVYLKLENLQPSGSFKSRGIGHYMLARLRELPSAQAAHAHFYSSSGGNAGLAAVHAAVALGRPCTVVVPLSTKAATIARMRRVGAHDVVQVGASWKDADTFLREELLAKDEGGVYVPPFDHEDIWAGHASMVQEMDVQLNGAAPDVVVAVETKGADSLAQSVERGKLVTLKGITSQATTLGAVRVAKRAFECGMRADVKTAVLSDADAAMGCWKLADEERFLVELSCGVSVAMCYDGRLEKALGRKLSPESKVVIVLCGGSNVSVDMMETWREEFGLEEGTSTPFTNGA